MQTSWDKTRKFNGKTYYFVGSTTHKKSAVDWAKQIRKESYKVRIIRQGNNYLTYTRPRW